MRSAIELRVHDTNRRVIPVHLTPESGRYKVTVTLRMADDGAIIAGEAAMFYPNLAGEIDQLVQELEEKIKSLHALQIDQEEDWKEWDVRVEVIHRIRLFEKDLIRLKESF